ncbi:MAG: aconitase family protein [Acetobacter sp.]
MTHRAHRILGGTASGRIVASREPLSFWGGIDPHRGVVIDVHHPLHGTSIRDAIVLLPQTRGSCTGSGVVLDLALLDNAPAALVFIEDEAIATLGAMIAGEMFDRPIPVLQVSEDTFAMLAQADQARITEMGVEADGLVVPFTPRQAVPLTLDAGDRAILAGEKGTAAALAMKIICTMAEQQGAEQLVDVVQGHIDGCIYNGPANLAFAERMAEMGAHVAIPTTINAISVEHGNWQRQGVSPEFGNLGQRLADAYVRMGCTASFTCAPYLLDTAPAQGEAIAWAESNAVIFANTVLGARTPKHADYLDLFMALTGRAPYAGVYLDANRQARRIITVEVPQGVDDAFWPLLGYMAGRLSPDRIPLIRGVAAASPTQDDLKALCAAFGTTSAAPMLHIEGVTPEAGHIDPAADHVTLGPADMRAAWTGLNEGSEDIQLVAVGSPHASAGECHALADALGTRRAGVPVILTTSRHVFDGLATDGTIARLQANGVQIYRDLCWCSIAAPLFPGNTQTVMTNSGKYAHYGPGLSGCAVRFGAIAQCADAAVTGRAARDLPHWLQ